MPKAQSIVANKLATQLPALDWLLRNTLIVAFAFLTVAIGLASVSRNLGLSILILWSGILALKLDEERSRLWLLSPIFLAVVPHLLGLGIGVPLYLAGIEQDSDEALFRTQIYYFVGFAAMLAGYFLARGQTKGESAFVSAKLVGIELRQNLARVGLIFYALWIVDTWAGIISGASDRSFAGEFTAENPFGWWTIFRAIRNSCAVGLLLFPLAYSISGQRLRVVLGASLIIQLGVAFSSGSREFLLLPVTYIIIGAYIFGTLRIKLQNLILLSVPIALFAFYFLYVFRSTSGFLETRASDIITRFAAVSDTKNVVLGADENFLSVTGSHLLDVSDPIVFLETPRTLPYAGWENVEAILWTWVPNFLVRDRPNLIDGNDIVARYTGVIHARSFSKVSLRADLYRRFGMAGVVLGALLFGILLASILRLIRFGLESRMPESGVLAILLIVTYYRTGLENQSLFTTWWQWTYDIPKNYVCLMIILLMVRSRGRLPHQSQFKYAKR
jgi:hypothetical protein